MVLLVNDTKAKDCVYRNIQKDSGWQIPARIHVEALYSIASEVLDKDFKEKIKHEFYSRCSEMYFAATCIDRLAIKISHPSDKGLDFFMDDFNCWVEVVTATDGDKGNINSIPDREEGVCYQYPENKVLLRLSNSFKEKAKKACDDIKKGLVEVHQPIVIFISGGGLSEFLPMHPDGGLPEIFKVLFPIGGLEALFNHKTKVFDGWQYLYRENIGKVKNDSTIPVLIGYFLDGLYSHVSAVIYSWANACNPMPREKFGSDFSIIHNPLAKNKLPMGLLKCGSEYIIKVDDDSFTILPKINYEK